MITYTGRAVFPDDSPHHTGEVPALTDIAVGLGRQSRFGGQTPVYYTVLCHTLVAAELVPDDFRPHVLLHDAAESVVSDVPTTWKGEEFKANENSLLGRISIEYGLGWTWNDEAIGYVERADFECLRAEAHVLGHKQAERWWPRSDWNAITKLAAELTLDMIAENNPFTYLEIERSVPTYLEALRSHGITEDMAKGVLLG